MATIIDLIMKVEDKATSKLKLFNEKLLKTGEIGRKTSKSFGSFDTTKLEKLSDRAANKVQGFSKELGNAKSNNDKLLTSISRVGTIGAFVAAIGTGTKALLEQTKALASQSTQLKNISDTTGISTRTIQGLSKAAESAGIETKDMTDAFRDFNFEIGDSIRSGGDVEKRFTRLGITLKDTQGNARDTEAVFNDFVDVISKIESTSERAQVVAKTLGEDNQKLIPIFAQGSESLGQYADQMERFGTLIEDDAIDRLSNLDKGLKALDGSFQSAKISIVETFGEPVTNLLLNFSKGVQLVFERESDLIKINKELAKSEVELTTALGGRIAATKEQLKLSNESEKAAKEREKRLKAEQKEIEKTTKALEKLENQASKELELAGLTENEGKLKKLNQEMDELIKKWGVDAPKALKNIERKQAEVVDDMRKEQKDFNDDLQNSLDKLEAGGAVPTRARELREQVAKRELGTEVEGLKEKAIESGGDAELVDEFREESLKKLEDGLSDVSESVDNVKESATEAKKELSESSGNAETFSDRVREVGKATEKVNGGLAAAFGQLSRFGGLALSFLDNFSGSGGSFGTARLANDPESIALEGTRRRAEALRETIVRAQEGAVPDFQPGSQALKELKEEFNQLSKQLGGIGTFREGSGRARALLPGGEQTINIVFTPDADIDNVSTQTQRQLAQAIAGAINQ